MRVKTKTGIIADARYMDHDMGSFHPESPKRVKAIMDMIEKEIEFPFLRVEPRPAREEEIRWIHTPGYFDILKKTAGKERCQLDPDTSTSARSFETALLAAGGLLAGIDSIFSGKIKNTFAAVRPPGHHAEASRAMGFCLFNNIAIATEYLLKKHGLHRILIVDWDLHHGNGTQNSFYSRKDVFYFSTHQYPHYPGTGHWSETGVDAGKGFNLNVPLSAGKTDADYTYIFKTVLAPVAEAYKPDFILVSAGFDTAFSDPLGAMEITSQGFSALARELILMAQKYSQDRILFVLEGGYDLDALKAGVKQVLLQLSGSAGEPDVKIEPSEGLQGELEPVYAVIKEYWSR